MAVMASERILLSMPGLRGCKRRACSLLRVFSTVSVNRGPPGERGGGGCQLVVAGQLHDTQGLHRAEYDRFGGVGISMARQSKLLPKHIHALLLRANDLRFGTVPHLFATSTSAESVARCGERWGREPTKLKNP